MKKAFIIPLVYGIALGCFGTYSVLDTLFIPKVKQSVSFDFNQYMSSNNASSSKNNPVSKPGDSSSDKYGSGFSFEDHSNSSSSGEQTSIFSDTVIQTADKYVYILEI